jgi:hypothetical protein
VDIHWLLKIFLNDPLPMFNLVSMQHGMGWIAVVMIEDEMDWCGGDIKYCT